ncbi:MAG: PqqD family protein [Bacteroidetes bacterium]|nr:PqqD family protein [Bacteroidota bacterium]
MRIKKNIAISESGYVFNPSTGESYTVNPIGIEIINMMQAGESFESIQKQVLNKYNVDADTFEKDYNDYTGFLNLHQLTDNDNGSES